MLVGDIEQRAIYAVIDRAEKGLLPVTACSLSLPWSEFEELMKLGSLMCPSQVIRLNEQNLLLDQLIQFIWGYRKDDNCIAKLTAGAIASASFGSQHLWQDLGLAGREEVTYLLESYFPNLASRNVNNFKWKKFLFMELGIAIGVKNLRPPKCKGCDQFKVCFP